MKALVTGAAGFVGSHVSEALLAQGAEVTGVDCFTDYYSRELKERNLAALRAHPKFKFHEIALQQADANSLLDGVDQVYHLAAQAGVRKSWGTDFRTYIDHNIDATQRLLEAAKGRSGLHRFVYASSSSVYGDVATIPMREAIALGLAEEEKPVKEQKAATKQAPKAKNKQKAAPKNKAKGGK